MRITRPESLKLYASRACLRCGDYDLRVLPRQELARISDTACRIKGPTGIASATKCAIVQTGVVVHVSKEVSIDMEASTFDVEITQADFPSYAAEVVWEDHGLPALSYMSDSVSMSICLDKIAGWGTLRTEMDTLAFPYDRLGAMLRGECVPFNSTGIMPTDSPLEDNEREAVDYMLRLFLRVMKFTSTSKVAITPKVTRNERKDIGLHPKQSAYVKSAVSIRYLPRVIREKADDAQEYRSECARRNITFKGRAGFVRWYKHERYVNMRGKSQIIWPIPAPEGYSILYRVRKPSTSSSNAQNKAEGVEKEVPQDIKPCPDPVQPEKTP